METAEARHALGREHQLQYPGGKDGWWRVDCALGDYFADEANVERARKRVQAHADAKNAANRPHPSTTFGWS